MCSISFTVVVMARSEMVVMRSAISWGDMPVYDQTTLTTGISIWGKMSVGILAIATAPRTTIRIAITTKVYGLRSASLTIHTEASEVELERNAAHRLPGGGAIFQPCVESNGTSAKARVRWRTTGERVDPTNASASDPH